MLQQLICHQAKPRILNADFLSNPTLPTWTINLIQSSNPPYSRVLY